jgi:hypothetical protein
MRRFYVASLLSGFVAGPLGAHLLADPGRRGAPEPRANVAQQEVVSARRIVLVDAAGRVRAELAMSADGGPGIFFYDTKGRNRLELGLYAPTESEYPFVVLNDTEHRAAGIFRLYGGHETPVVVLKNQGRDRSVYGLNPNSTEPFLVTYSNDGKKGSIFGTF